MQGGDKTEVTLSDIETLFGEPDQVHEEIDMSVADNVYQYKYDNITVNFHDRYSYIQEYVLEDFFGDLYEPQTFDQMFLELLPQNEGISNDEDNPISEKELLSFINESPTREIHQHGWASRSSGPRYYFDTGDGEFAPEEYLIAQFDENDASELILIERRYDEVFSQTNPSKEVLRKKLRRDLRENLNDVSDEMILVRDLMNEFGDISKLTYDYRYDTLSISWIIMEDDKREEISAEISITDSNRPSTMTELNNLEAESLRYNNLSEDSRIISTDEFIKND